MSRSFSPSEGIIGPFSIYQIINKPSFELNTPAGRNLLISQCGIRFPKGISIDLFKIVAQNLSDSYNDRMTNDKPYIIGVAGHKRSGKTTLVELLCQSLTARGYLVGTIKSTSHALAFDTPGKDTFRHRQAGSALTLIRSAGEMVIFTDPVYLDQKRLWKLFEDCNFVIVEGDSKSSIPKIYIASGQGQKDDISGPIVVTFGPPDEGKEKAPGGRNFAIDEIDKLCDYLLELARENKSA